MNPLLWSLIETCVERGEGFELLFASAPLTVRPINYSYEVPIIVIITIFTKITAEIIVIKDVKVINVTNVINAINANFMMNKMKEAAMKDTDMYSLALMRWLRLMRWLPWLQWFRRWWGLGCEGCEWPPGPRLASSRLTGPGITFTSVKSERDQAPIIIWKVTRDNHAIPSPTLVHWYGD